MTHSSVRVWGAEAVQSVMQHWQAGLRKLQPDLSLEARLTGSDVGMAGLYTGCAEIALLGRESTPVESKAFEWIYRYPPARVEVMTGGLHEEGKSPALRVFVHQDNPLAQLTLVQLDAIFGPERLRGCEKGLRTWGDVGLTGEWAHEPIRLYADDAESGTGRFFRRAVLGDSRKMNWEQLKEFTGPDTTRRIQQAVAADRFGLAVAGGTHEAAAQVKALAIARGPGDEYVQATRESLISRRYPLTRIVYAYFNHPFGTALPAAVGAVLRYILSPEGQQEIALDTDYLPLSQEAAREQLRTLR